MIALGGNVADPPAALPLAWSACCAALDLQASELSSLHATAPAEQASGPSFVNAVGVGWSACDPRQGLSLLQAIEQAFGRDRPREGFHGARPLDLDVIAIGDLHVAEPGLQVPHPRWSARSFVVLPLAEVAPDLCDSSGLSAAELARTWLEAPRGPSA
ncbi:MAG: 2-amino-4-hydroxy-6-hydroxymethyldihydropteridine diphosphokinase [Deltaproteobacteria bacterium]|nr:2-amino-4-hydroxy-6-hydroxymethyldihydropteridine diphosphokinase [Deltaproteobacteria bacterium]